VGCCIKQNAPLLEEELFCKILRHPWFLQTSLRWSHSLSIQREGTIQRNPASTRRTTTWTRARDDLRKTRTTRDYLRPSNLCSWFETASRLRRPPKATRHTIHLSEACRLSPNIVPRSRFCCCWRKSCMFCWESSCWDPSGTPSRRTRWSTVMTLLNVLRFVHLTVEDRTVPTCSLCSYCLGNLRQKEWILWKLSPYRRSFPCICEGKMSRENVCFIYFDHYTVSNNSSLQQTSLVVKSFFIYADFFKLYRISFRCSLACAV